MQRLWSFDQGPSYPILHCAATDSLRHTVFGDSLSLYDFWSRSCKVVRILGSIVLRHALSLERSQIATTAIEL